MNKVISAILLTLVAIGIAACVMLPSLSADLTERQANELIFQQSIRVVTLEGRLTKAMEAAQDTVYAMERREKLLEETAMKLQTAMDDLSKAEEAVDESACKLRGVQKNLLETQLDLKRNILDSDLLRYKVRDLSNEVKDLKKKLKPPVVVLTPE